jgi:hypothetical protein
MMNCFDKREVMELVKKIKYLQENITEKETSRLWFEDITMLDGFSPSEELYEKDKMELPELKIKLVQYENELDKLLEGITDNE